MSGCLERLLAELKVVESMKENRSLTGYAMAVKIIRLGYLGARKSAEKWRNLVSEANVFRPRQ